MQTSSLRNTETTQKPIIYHVFTRLFGNKEQENKAWGDKETNGVGKFSDFTDVALQEIRDLGATHIWYTGVLHHAMIQDYSDIGISADHPAIVKGRAGSPYAIKDYYQVDPDLADNPAKRMEEFEQLIMRSHSNKLKVIIDIVPNHVARLYKGLNNPEHVLDFGVHDDTTVIYQRDNNFYYIPETPFEQPDFPDTFLPLGGEMNSEINQPYIENPAKWTGNGSRSSKPNLDDWYETVKINYGVRPDGSKDFPELPEVIKSSHHSKHFKFWQQQSVPNSWQKFRDIVLFWLDKGVDGFRYDVAELVPVEFWSYLNSTIKHYYPNTFLLAEVYQPDLYRDFIHIGKMDYLYDKVGLHDTLRRIIRSEESTEAIGHIHRDLLDIEQHMLRFLENHDEQRIASPEFAGDADQARPAMLVSAALGSSATMIYFGQEVGEPGAEDAGFGQPSRTSIFDYIGVPKHQKWVNSGAFDGGRLNIKERELRQFYKSVLNYAKGSVALQGKYIELYTPIQNQLDYHRESMYLFSRKKERHIAIIVVNFSNDLHCKKAISIPNSVIKKWQLTDGHYRFEDRLEQTQSLKLSILGGIGEMMLDVPPLGSFAFELV